MTGDDDRSPIGRRVVEAVADERGVDPLEFEPLYRVVDPDCLDRVFREDTSLVGRDAGRIEFPFGGCLVTVRSDRSVVVSPLDDETTGASDGRPTGSSRASEPPD